MATPDDKLTGWQWSVPSTLPKFNETLNLKIVERCLVGPPGGLDFIEIDLFCRDAESVMHLMSNYSEISESLKVHYFVVVRRSLSPSSVARKRLTTTCVKNLTDTFS